MYSAFNKDEIEYGKKKMTICVVNNKFRSRSYELRDRIFKEVNGYQTKRFASLIHLINDTNSIWNLIVSNADLTQYDNLKNLQDKTRLSDQLKKIME